MTGMKKSSKLQIPPTFETILGKVSYFLQVWVASTSPLTYFNNFAPPSRFICHMLHVYVAHIAWWISVIFVFQVRRSPSGPKLVAVKSLSNDCSSSVRADFEQEARVLTSLDDPNLVGVLGVCFNSDPLCMICEYSDRGDLCQFLQDHVAETTLSKSPGVPTLR